MKEKSKVKTARDLSILDTVFQVESAPMVEHMKLRDWESVSLSGVQYFSLQKEVIKGINVDDEDDPKMIVLNGKIELPLKGKLKPSVDDIHTDEGVAVAIVLSEIAKEKKRCLDLIKLAEECLQGLASNAKIYEDRAKELNVAITIKDGDETILETDKDESE